MILKDKFKLFMSKQCQLCSSARKMLQGKEYRVFDVDEVDGLAEASYYGVLSTPTLLMVDNEGEEVGRWTGEEIRFFDKARERANV